MCNQNNISKKQPKPTDVGTKEVLKRVKLGSPKYTRMELELLRGYLLTYPCRVCGGPVVDGYVCIWCPEDQCASAVKRESR